MKKIIKNIKEITTNIKDKADWFIYWYKQLQKYKAYIKKEEIRKKKKEQENKEK